MLPVASHLNHCTDVPGLGDVDFVMRTQMMIGEEGHVHLAPPNKLCEPICAELGCNIVVVSSAECSVLSIAVMWGLRSNNVQCAMWGLRSNKV